MHFERLEIRFIRLIRSFHSSWIRVRVPNADPDLKARLKFKKLFQPCSFFLSQDFS